MALPVHVFLRAHRDAILRDWQLQASADPNGVKLVDSVLWGHLPEFLEELSAWLERGGQSGTTEMRAVALEHALNRLEHSEELAQVIRELGLLRTIILRLLLEAEAVEGGGHVRAEDRIAELARLNAGLDVATSEVVEQFIAAKDRRNLAERKRAEDARGESERRLRLHIESTPVAVVEYDHHFRITAWNPAAEAIFGWSAAEAMGQTATLIVPESARPHVDEIFRRLLNRKSGQRNINENITKDGRIITCDWNNTALVSSDGEVIGVASMALDVSERVRAEAALAQREQRLQAILHTALDGFYRVDVEGVLVDVNDAYCEMSGFRREDLLGMRLSDLEAAETKQEIAARTERIRRLGGDRFETRHLRKDGRVIDVEASVRYLADEGGTIVCFVRDITERKHAEEVLRESEERFRTMANGAPVILWVTNTRGENQFVNRTYLEYFGVAFDDVLGAKWQSFIHPEDAKAHVDLVLSAALEHRAFDGEIRVRRKDGEWRFTENHGRPSFSTSGEFLGHVGVTLDIGDRKHAERALRDSEERLRVVVQAVGEGIVMRRRDGVIAVFNPAAERLTGLTASQMEGLSPCPPGWFTVREDGKPLPPEERPNRVALRTGKSSNVIMGNHMPGGEIKWLSVNTTPVFEPGQSAPYAVVATYVDITAQRKQAAVRRQLEEQLQQSQKLESVGRLAGGIAHDFNNLLTVVLSCTEALKEDVAKGSPVQPDLVDEIQAAGKRAAELTHQLLAFARKEVIAPVPLDLNDLVGGSEKLLRRVLGEDVELVTSLQPALWTVRCDQGQMEQVILNLAINARDAMPGGGKLKIETENIEVDEGLVASNSFMRAGPHVRLSIKDSGIGMTKEAKAHVFEPFFTTKPQGKGTGLGLAMVYGIMKQNEGYILVESEVGQGTTFELYLPKIGDAAAKEATPPTTTIGGTETILVVEDDLQVRKVTLRCLLAGGYRVMVASSGREALELEAREEGPVDLLVTDVVMPGTNGREVADELRRRRPDLRVLFISGYTQDVISRSGVLDSGIEFLTKPFTAALLLERVRKVLDVNWTERLATGIEEIDSQHRALLANVVALKEAARGGDLHRSLDTLHFLEGYVSDHFTAEERHMRSAGYPGLAEHCAIHETFAKEYRQRKSDFEANGSLVSLLLGLSDWLNGWLCEHIRGADTQMAEYLRSHP